MFSEQEYRRIQKVGEGGYCISVPSKYAKILQLKPHQLMKLSLEDNRILMEGITV